MNHRRCGSLRLFRLPRDGDVAPLVDRQVDRLCITGRHAPEDRRRTVDPHRQVFCRQSERQLATRYREQRQRERPGRTRQPRGDREREVHDMQAGCRNRHLQTVATRNQSRRLAIKLRVARRHFAERQFDQKLPVHEAPHGEASGHVDRRLVRSRFVGNDLRRIQCLDHAACLRCGPLLK